MGFKSGNSEHKQLLIKRKQFANEVFRVQFLLQEKLLTQRIVEDEFAKIKIDLEGKPIGELLIKKPKPQQREDDLNAFEHELHFKMTQELHTREKDAKMIMDILRTKEQEI